MKKKLTPIGHYCIFILLGITLSTITHAGPIDSLEELLSKKKGKDRIDLLIAISSKTFYNDTEKARSYAREVIALTPKTEETKPVADAFRIIGITFDIEGVRDSSRYYFDRTYQLSLALQDDKRIAASLNTLGMWHWNSGLFDRALNYFFQSVKASEKAGELEILSKAYNNIGLIYQELNQYDHAKVYNIKAYQLRQENSWTSGTIHSCNNLGICYKNLGQLDSAKYFYNIGLALAHQIDDEHSISQINHNLGVIEMILENYPEAIRLINTALNYQISPLRNLLSHNTLSEIYFKMDEPDLCLIHALISLNLIKQLGNKGHQEDVFYNLANAYYLNEDYRNSHRYFDQLIRVKDELFSSESARIYSDLQVGYETEKKEQQIALQAAELEAKDLTIQRNTFLLLGLLIILIMASMLFYLWQKRLKAHQAAVLQEQKVRMREAQIKSVIQSQEAERQRFATDLHDGIGQLINAIQLNIEGLRNENNGQLEKRVELYENSSKLLNDMNQEIRNIAFNLMPQILIKEGLFSTLRELARRINQSGQLLIEIQHEGFERRPEEVIEISLYRIIQELISNIIKYAQAKNVFIQFTMEEGKELTLTLEDDGEGYDLDLFKSDQGNGWRNINSRLNLIGGEMSIDTQPGRKGTTVIVDIPLKTMPSVQRPVIEADKV